MERLKQKVASSSSRVIASLQQAAAMKGSASNQPATSAASGLAPEELQGIEQQQQAIQENTLPMASVAAGQTSTSARLMAADATAHLTDKERKILLEVFKKEEQFQRDTIK